MNYNIMIYIIIFLNSENSKTSDSHGLLINVSDKTD